MLQVKEKKIRPGRPCDQRIFPSSNSANWEIVNTIMKILLKKKCLG